MKFATQFSRPPAKKENFTNQMQKVYKVDFDKKTGERILKVEKEINIVDKINEYKDEVEIKNILQKYNVNLLSNLKQEEEKLVDLTNLPENLMETMAVIDGAKHAWDMQSKTIKEKFGNDFKKFIAASENGQLAELLNKELKTSAERFATNNMSNYQGQQLINYEAQQKQAPQQAQQSAPQQAQQSNYNLGENSNV